MTSMNSNFSSDTNAKGKVLLALLPFWAPLIPPLGIANLKSFLQARGYRVKGVDANLEPKFRDFSSSYFELLKQQVPPAHWGNFYVVGKDVLQNHLMAYLHDTGRPDGRCAELVKILVDRTFFSGVNRQLVEQLNRAVAEFYGRLQQWFLELLEQEQPEVVGFSVFESTLPASLFAARLTKTVSPRIKTVLGGGVFSEQLALGSPNWELFLQKTPYIDRLIIGEGENLLLEELEEGLPGTGKVATLQTIGHQTLDLATAEIPDFSDFDLAQYPFIAAYTSRSCPFQCSFCSETVFYGKYRKKEASQIVREMTALYRQHGRQLFLMCDSLLNPVVDPLARALADSRQILYWDGYLRVDPRACDPDNTLLWRRGGFYKAKLGIESGSPRILELMDKRITLAQIRQTVSSLAYAGIKTSACWVIGHPGETEADFQLTLDLVEELKDDIYEVWSSPFYYYPSAQANMRVWEKDAYPLYPDWAADLLLIQTWYPACEPSREETYQRMYRFVQHCRRLGIPNPYTLHDLYRADLRWKKLHENAVPALMEFEKAGTGIDDTGNVRKIVKARSREQDDGDFGF
jgi:radical SAM superfamily enzyme YgiQ (UPF0313 family)